MYVLYEISILFYHLFLLSSIISIYTKEPMLNSFNFHSIYVSLHFSWTIPKQDDPFRPEKTNICESDTLQITKLILNPYGSSTEPPGTPQA